MGPSASASASRPPYSYPTKTLSSAFTYQAYQTAFMATTIFSIQTPQDSRPYFNRLRFLAYDFEHWGYSVTEHESDSEYVRETRQRNNYIGLADARPSLWEVWAQEVVKQRQLNQAPPAVSDTCLHRVSEMLHDFVWALATQGKL
jgi:hypothetical protein